MDDLEHQALEFIMGGDSIKAFMKYARERPLTDLISIRLNNHGSRR